MQRNCQLFRPAVDDDDADQALFDIGEVRKDNSSRSNTNNGSNLSALSPVGIAGDAFVDRRRWGGPHNSDPNTNGSSNNTSAEALKCFINLSAQQANSKKQDDMQWQKITEYRKAKQQGKQSGNSNSGRGSDHPPALESEDLLPHQAVYGIPLKGMETDMDDQMDDNEISDGEGPSRSTSKSGANGAGEEGTAGGGSVGGSVPRKNHKSMDSTNESAGGDRSTSRTTNGAESSSPAVLTSEVKPGRKARTLKPLTAKEHQQHVIRSTQSPPAEEDTASPSVKRSPETSAERVRLPQLDGQKAKMEECGGVAVKSGGSGSSRRAGPRQRTSVGSDGIGVQLPTTIEGKSSPAALTDPGHVTKKDSRASVLQGGSDDDEEPTERTEMQW